MHYYYKVSIWKIIWSTEMKYEYSVKVFSMEELKMEGVVVDPQKNIVYACRPDGECEAHDMTEQLENLSEIFNRMG